METVLLLGVPPAHGSSRSGKQEYARYIQTGIMQTAHVNHHFRLYTFPSELRFAAIRYKWILAINRETKKKKPWKPGKSDVVCSVHFIEAMPTALNPDPTLELEHIKKGSETIFHTGLSMKVLNVLFKILKPHLPTLEGKDCCSSKT